MTKKFDLAFFRKAGEQGGRIGGKRRAKVLSAAERKKIAQKAAKATWSKKTKTNFLTRHGTRPTNKNLGSEFTRKTMPKRSSKRDRAFLSYGINRGCGGNPRPRPQQTRGNLRENDGEKCGKIEEKSKTQENLHSLSFPIIHKHGNVHSLPFTTIAV